MHIMIRIAAAGLLLFSMGSAAVASPADLIELYPKDSVKPLPVPEIRADQCPQPIPFVRRRAFCALP